MAIVRDEGKVYFLFADNTEFWIHCTSEVSPSYASNVTELEVEEGAETTDHIRPVPPTLNLNGFMSELDGQEQNKAYDDEFQGDHTAFHERIIQAWEKSELVSVDARKIRGLYADMAIMNYAPVWSSSDDDGLSLNFSLQLKHIRFTQLKRTSVEAAKQQVDKNKITENGVRQKMSPTTKSGNVSTLNPSESLTNKALRVKQPAGAPAGDWTRGPA